MSGIRWYDNIIYDIYILSTAPLYFSYLVSKGFSCRDILWKLIHRFFLVFFYGINVKISSISFHGIVIFAIQHHKMYSLVTSVFILRHSIRFLIINLPVPDISRLGVANHMFGISTWIPSFLFCTNTFILHYWDIFFSIHGTLE